MEKLKECPFCGSKGFMEKTLARYTHCFFPKELFDEVIFLEKLVLGRIGQAYAAIHSNNDIEICEEELVQSGNLTIWITELSGSDSESFDDFKKRMIDSSTTFNEDEKSVLYNSHSKEYMLKYKDEFTLCCNPRVIISLGTIPVTLEISIRFNHIFNSIKRSRTRFESSTL